MRAITAIVVSHGYDGIDLDYENLPASNRDVFSAFVKALASSLHARGKLLSVTVHPKTSEPGSWNGPKSQEYRAIGSAADRAIAQRFQPWNAASVRS